MSFVEPSLSVVPQTLAEDESYLVSVEVSGNLILYPRRFGSPTSLTVVNGRAYIFSGKSIAALALDPLSGAQATFSGGVANSAAGTVPANLSGVAFVTLTDQFGNPAIGFNPGGSGLAAPATGEFFGYAVSLAAGAVIVRGITIATASAAGLTTYFRIFVTAGQLVVATNATVLGGGVRP